MKFIDNNILTYSGSYFNVSKNNGVATMRFQNNTYLTNTEQYTELFLGKCSGCNTFFKDSFDGFEFDTVLVVGLGLGLIPQELIELNKCSKVDCLEISQEMIDYTITSGHLNNDINLIQGDVYNYTTSDLYDLIIIDIIWYDSEMNEEQYQSLATKFTNNLNTGGALYVPVIKKWMVK